MKMTTFESCPSCEAAISPGQSHCSCGRPTQYASFEERAAYEVSLWRAHRDRSTVAASA